MGITGLLPFLKNIIKKKTIDEFHGSRIAIDGFSWIHRISTHVSYELYNSIKTDKHIKIFRSELVALIHKNIIPIFILDGDKLDSKLITYNHRQNLKEKYLGQLKIAIENHDNTRARDLMKRVVTITPDFIYDFIKELEILQVEYIIAPYEADSQMAYLNKINYVDHIMSEDSDLICYGAKSVLFKYNGIFVDHYKSEDLSKAYGSFFAKNILDICILSGCDYINSIKGIGLITAVKLFQKEKTVEKFVTSLAHKKTIPSDYIEQFYQAKKTFLYHIVYNPINKKRLYFNETSKVFPFLGSLDLIPYIICLEDGVNLTIERHFKPFNN